MIMLAALLPNTVANALAVRSLPTSLPHGTDHIISPEAFFETLDESTARAVREHITMVSTKTSNMPYIPCFTGSVSLVAAWAIGAVPRPASLEKIPRPAPYFIDWTMVMPNAPPITLDGENAPLKMAVNASPKRSICPKITINAETTYTIAINGTSFSAKAPIREIPPITTIPTITARMAPMAMLIAAEDFFASGLKLWIAVLIDVAIVLLCVIFPVPIAVNIPRIEKITASHFQFFPRPFFM